MKLETMERERRISGGMSVSELERVLSVDDLLGTMSKMGRRCARGCEGFHSRRYSHAAVFTAARTRGAGGATLVWTEARVLSGVPARLCLTSSTIEWVEC